MNRPAVEEKLTEIEREFRGQLLEVFGARLREGFSIPQLAAATGRTERQIRGLLFGSATLSLRAIAELSVAMKRPERSEALGDAGPLHRDDAEPNSDVE